MREKGGIKKEEGKKQNFGKIQKGGPGVGGNKMAGR